MDHRLLLELEVLLVLPVLQVQLDQRVRQKLLLYLLGLCSHLLLLLHRMHLLLLGLLLLLQIHLLLEVLL